MKKLIYGLVGLSLLSSIAFAKDLEISVHINYDIIEVANKEALNKDYEGDVFFHYRKKNNSWVLDKLTYNGEGRYTREFVENVSKEEIPTYIEGLHALYYDSDQDEEILVAVFDNIDVKVMSTWIKQAKEHIKKINSQK